MANRLGKRLVLGGFVLTARGSPAVAPAPVASWPGATDPVAATGAGSPEQAGPPDLDHAAGVMAAGQRRASRSGGRDHR